MTMMTIYCPKCGYIFGEHEPPGVPCPVCNRDTEFTIHCTYCCRDVVGRGDACDRCGTDFSHGMEYEVLETMNENYLELIKFFIRSYSDLKIRSHFIDNLIFEFPGAQQYTIIPQISRINTYVEAEGFDNESAAQALQDIAKRLKENKE